VLVFQSVVRVTVIYGNVVDRVVWKCSGTFWYNFGEFMNKREKLSKSFRRCVFEYHRKSSVVTSHDLGFLGIVLVNLYNKEIGFQYLSN
jgi:hypothetical protein